MSDKLHLCINAVCLVVTDCDSELMPVLSVNAPVSFGCRCKRADRTLPDDARCAESVKWAGGEGEPSSAIAFRACGGTNACSAHMHGLYIEGNPTCSR